MMKARISPPGRLRLRNGLLALVVAATQGGGTGATTITVTDYLNARIFQSIGNSRVVPVLGTYTGEASSIQARAVDYFTGAEIAPWTTIHTDPTGGEYSGQLDTPGGSWYRLQVRDGINHAVTAQGANRFGVGSLGLMIGQSNMLHLSTAILNYPAGDDRTRRFQNGAWARIGGWKAGVAPGTPAFGTGGYSGGHEPASPNGDGIVTFANSLCAALGAPVGTFEYAVSGSNITSWQPGSGANWTALANALTAAGGDCEYAVWYQGENNASAGTTIAAYKTYLLNVLNGIYALTGRNATNFHFGVVTLGPTISYGPEGSFGRMRQAVLEFIAETPGTFLAGVAGDAEVPSGDPVHITLPWQVRMGRRYAKSVAARLAGADKPGPKIASATRSGSTVTAAISGGTGVLKDGVGGAGASLQGFRVFDNGVAATISGTAISGSAVVLTLAAAPAGPVTLDYGMANLPYGVVAPPPASVLYDSDTIPGDTLGLPLQPLAAITVTGS